MVKWVYTFGDGRAEGASRLSDLLGGKGANLAEMAKLGLPVPPGFTITTEVCAYFYANEKRFPAELESQVETALAYLGGLTGKAFGDQETPLLVSVRSGARASMPGMMDTVLNLGLNDLTVEALARHAGDARFAYDSYRRFIQMYSSVVLRIEHRHFEEILEDYKELKGLSLDTELAAEDWKRLIVDFKAKVEEEFGAPFPQAPREQLWGAIAAVFGSWMTARAITYRSLHDIPISWGTAVNVQAMVFGNMGETSATGVAFTRNPATGAKELYGEFLLNAQGEDVVAGIRTPQNITEAARLAAGSDKPSLETALPEVFAEFVKTTNLLEKHYRDMQDVEFTVEEGKLWMLQTRDGKRTSKADLRIAVDMANEGLISRDEAILRVDPPSLEQLLHPAIDPDALRRVIAVGLPASPGAATGEIVFDSDEAQRLKAAGRKVILVRVETSPEDIHGMHAAEAVVTARGGMTSHAAVVARGMGKPCVSGAGGIKIDYAAGVMTVAGIAFEKGDLLTVDGTSGQVIQGEVNDDSGRSLRRIRRAHGMGGRRAPHGRSRQCRDAAGRPHGAQIRRRGHRPMPHRAYVLRGGQNHRRAGNDSRRRRGGAARRARQAASDSARRLHRIIRDHGGPAGDDPFARPPSCTSSCRSARTRSRRWRRPWGSRPKSFSAASRPCARSIPCWAFAAAGSRSPIRKSRKCRPAPFSKPRSPSRKSPARVVQLEIMVPLIIAKAELDLVKASVDAMAKAVGVETGEAIPYSIGAMIETPRASLRAGEIAETAEFFSFGTNDLTQTCLALSRDDAGSFLGRYVAKGHLRRRSIRHARSGGRRRTR